MLQALIALSVLGVAALLAVWYFQPPAWELLLILVGIGAMVFLSSVPFLIAYFQAHALAERARAQGWRPEASAPPVAELRPRRYSDYIPWWWELLPLALICATAAYLAYTYPDAPDPFPTHFDINGNPNAFSPKTVGSYFLIVFVQIFMWALITVLTYLVVRAKSLPGREETGFKRIVLRFLFAIKALAIGFMGVVGSRLGLCRRQRDRAAGVVSRRHDWLHHSRLRDGDRADGARLRKERATPASKRLDDRPHGR